MPRPEHPDRRITLEGTVVSLHSFAVDSVAIPGTRRYVLELGEQVVDTVDLNEIHHRGELRGVLESGAGQRRDVSLSIWWVNGDYKRHGQRIRLCVDGRETEFPVRPLPIDVDVCWAWGKMGDTRWAEDALAMGTLFYQVSCLIENLQIDAAEERLSPFLEENPSNCVALELLFDCACERASWDDALAIAERLPGPASCRPSRVVRRAVALEELGRLTEAYEAAGEALYHDRHNLQARAIVARCLHEQGRAEEAFKKAARGLDDHSLSALCAEVAEAALQSMRRRGDVHRSQELESSPGYQAHLAWLALSEGDGNGAVSAFSHAAGARRSVSSGSEVLQPEEKVGARAALAQSSWFYRPFRFLGTLVRSYPRNALAALVMLTVSVTAGLVVSRMELMGYPPTGGIRAIRDACMATMFMASLCVCVPHVLTSLPFVFTPIGRASLPRGRFGASSSYLLVVSWAALGLLSADLTEMESRLAFSHCGFWQIPPLLCSLLARSRLLRTLAALEFGVVCALLPLAWIFVLRGQDAVGWSLYAAGAVTGTSGVVLAWVTSLLWPDRRRPIRLHRLSSMEDMERSRPVGWALTYAGFEWSTLDSSEAVVLLVTEHVWDDIWAREGLERVLRRRSKHPSPRLFTYPVDDVEFPPKYREYEELAVELPRDVEAAVSVLRDWWPERVHVKGL